MLHPESIDGFAGGGCDNREAEKVDNSEAHRGPYSPLEPLSDGGLDEAAVEEENSELDAVCAEEIEDLTGISDLLCVSVSRILWRWVGGTNQCALHHIIVPEC